jgi:hypothetical protein
VVAVSNWRDLLGLVRAVLVDDDAQAKRELSDLFELEGDEEAAQALRQPLTVWRAEKFGMYVGPRDKAEHFLSKKAAMRQAALWAVEEARVACSLDLASRIDPADLLEQLGGMLARGEHEKVIELYEQSVPGGLGMAVKDLDLSSALERYTPCPSPTSQ